MQDDHLLQDLDETVKPRHEKYDWLAENGIISYSQLFAFIKDESAGSELREKACWVLFLLSKKVDKRRAVAVLLKALKTDNTELQSAAVVALGHMHSRRAIDPLIQLLSDPTQPVSLRQRAIDALALDNDQRILPLLRQIIDSPDENIDLRSRAIEMLYEEPSPLQYFSQLLSDSSADIRFWAAYKLAFLYADNTLALSALDEVAAFDHHIPTYWGWHVDREAIFGLEGIYFHQFGQMLTDEEDEEEYLESHYVYLISPAPEYGTFIHNYRQSQPDSTYSTRLPPEIKLKIYPEWLTKHLHAQWPEIRLNVRQPRPQAYLLDWLLTIDERTLIGALHRDQYAVVLTGNQNVVGQFAAWYRSIFPAQQPLFFYQWADEGIEIQLEMSAEALRQAMDERDESRRNWTAPAASASTQTEIT